MTHNEFKQIAKVAVSEDFFNAEINPVYMAAEELDKQTFCEEYKKCGDSPLVKSLYNTTHYQNNRINGLISELNTANSKTASMAHELILKSITMGCPEMYNIAQCYIGVQAAIEYKLQNELPLTTEDYKWLHKRLTDNM